MSTGQYRPISAVVLAAGEGTRMRSDTPKVLHPLCGRPMLLHVIDALVALPLERIVVVVGHGAERVTKTLQEQVATEMPIEFVEQRVQRGTGDAASVALTASGFDGDGEDDLLVVPADTPLLRPETLAHARPRPPPDRRRRHPADRGRRRPDRLRPGRARRQRPGRRRSSSRPTPPTSSAAINEVNPSIYCFRRGLLAPALRRLSPENAQGEYYLTDVDRRAARSRPPGARRARRRPDRDRRRQRPRPARRRRGRAARPHQRPLDARGRHDDRSRPHLRRRVGRARARRPAAARHDPRRPHGRSAPAR